MSMRRKETLCWDLASALPVRTTQNIQSAQCACVVQVFWPVMR